MLLMNNLDDVTELNSPLFLQEDIPLVEKYGIYALYLSYACSEIIGSRTGEYLVENEDGTKNFDQAALNPLTGLPIDSW